MAEKEQQGDTQMGKSPASSDVESSPPPPTYTEAPPPAYQASSSASSSRAGALAYRPIPALINGYGEWSLDGIKYFSLCGTSDSEKLFLVELHTGYSGKEPLGNRPGLLIHNGLNKQDPILAAAGKTSISVRACSFDTTSVVLLRPVGFTGPFDAGRRNFIDEPFKTGRTAGSPSFAFPVEVSIGQKLRRQRFEWRRVAEGQDQDLLRGGYRLVRIPRTGSVRIPDQQAESSSRSDAGAAGEEPEPLALLL